MATVLQLRFPGRRYHATPWGSHVNEGQVEWPPSPWRIMRALLATGFTKLHWAPNEPPPVARRLIEHLAMTAPSYALPPVAVAHSRHYVDAAGKKPLIFDAWLQVDDGVLEVSWDIELPADERELLGELAVVLGYLGRAESWTEARLVAQREQVHNCTVDRGAVPGPGWEAVRVQGALAAETYADWRSTQVASILAMYSASDGKKLTAAQAKKRDKALAPYPEDLVAALCADTAVLQSQGWSSAPGSRELIYWRPSDALRPGVPRRTVRSAPAAVQFALLSLTTASRGTSALPPCERVFPQGRLLHRALASVIGRAHDSDPELALSLLGQQDGSKALHDHQHAHILHLSLALSSRLDHALVYAPQGLDGGAQSVLRGLKRTYMKGGAGELQVSVVALGDADALRQMTAPVGPALEMVLGAPGGTTHWRTATPYVAPRRTKKRGKDSLEGQIELECVRRGMPRPAAIRVSVPGSSGEEARRFRHFVLHDQTRRPPWPAACHVELVFDEPVEGPICLGYGAHAGLGRFEARPTGTWT
jgi:CRISPR-associated protein Csb2